MLEYVCHRTCLAEAGPTLFQVVHQSLQDSQDEISRSVHWGRRSGGGGYDPGCLPRKQLLVKFSRMHK